MSVHPVRDMAAPGKEHLVSEWIRFGHMKEKPDPKTMAALTTTGRDGTKLSIEMIGERTAIWSRIFSVTSTELHL